jgi:hypothetical protein
VKNFLVSNKKSVASRDISSLSLSAMSLEEDRHQDARGGSDLEELNEGAVEYASNEDIELSISIHNCYFHCWLRFSL